MREKISACVAAFNQERKIRRCLQSLVWCDEIVVVDSFSTDRTVEVCFEFTERVYQHEWLGYVGQRNLVRDLAENSWVLSIDSDEEVSPALRDEIIAEFERGTQDTAGYEFPRQVYYLGRWIRHGEWYPDVKLRLFRKAYGRTEGEEPHDRVVVRGKVKRLKNPIWHYTYDDMSDQVDTANRFSTITAQQRYVKGVPFRSSNLIVRPLFRFFRGYFLRGGFRDGMHGFVVAVVAAFSAFLKYAKQWELVMRHKQQFRDLPDEADMKDGVQ
jgi:glycosyltransferase involved in cell wall biosynthesis